MGDVYDDDDDDDVVTLFLVLFRERRVFHKKVEIFSRFFSPLTLSLCISEAETRDDSHKQKKRGEKVPPRAGLFTSKE